MDGFGVWTRRIDEITEDYDDSSRLEFVEKCNILIFYV